MSTTTPSALNHGYEASSNRRLNGWKEIAAHFGKGVRTVQRWERELGLPVRRSGTEIVYAFTSELDAWHLGPGSVATDGSPQPSQVEPTSGTTRGTVARGWWWALGLLCAVGLGGYLWTTRSAHAQPYSFRIENQALRIFAEDGHFLWERRFPDGLRDDRYAASAIWMAHAVIIHDLDGDGSREVLFNTALERPTDVALYCFNSDGVQRFAHRPTYKVRFGDAVFSGPWKPTVAAVVPGEKGRSDIWLASHHQDEFPSVVEKIDPKGAVVGRYWSNGTVNVLEPYTLAERRVVLAGGANNDTLGATLAVLDATRPDGRAPASKAKYTCIDCSPAWPAEFLVFPPTDIQRALHVTSAVEEVRIGSDGTLSVAVANDISAAVPNGSLTRGQARYVFDSRLQPVRAEIESSFRLVHDNLFRRGLLGHAAGAPDERDLWPVLRWDSDRFRETLPPGLR